MLLRVLEQCSAAKSCQTVAVCTDSLEIFQQTEDWGFKAVMTPHECTSGSERIGYALDTLLPKADLEESLVINVQADQPFIAPSTIDRLHAICTNQRTIPDVVTPIYELTDPAKISDPNVVKVVTRKDGIALYFSRAAIPWDRNSNSPAGTCWGHVGIYGYRASLLKKWPTLPVTRLELVESLEYLRLLEHGYQIQTFPTEEHGFSVDTAYQLEVARKIARANRIRFN